MGVEHVAQAQPQIVNHGMPAEPWKDPQAPDTDCDLCRCCLVIILILGVIAFFGYVISILGNQKHQLLATTGSGGTTIAEGVVYFMIAGLVLLGIGHSCMQNPEPPRED